MLKGGMALRLLDSPRLTTDIDYVFAPFSSKQDVRPQIERVLGEIEGAVIRLEVHSKMIRADVRVDSASIQVEVTVALECPGIAMATGGFARLLGHPSQVIRVMSLPHALAQKLAAWNERRLLRDLYDCYFLFARAGGMFDGDALDLRLARIESRHPLLRGRRSMSRADLARELRAGVDGLTEESLQKELGGLLPVEEMAGASVRIGAAARRLAELLEQSPPEPAAPPRPVR